MRSIGGLVSFSITAGLLIGLFGCDEQPNPSSAKPAASTSKPASQISESDKAALRSMMGSNKGAANELPPGHPPLDGAATPAGPLPSAPPAANAPAASAAEMQFDAPTTWKATPPKSAMRRAQFNLPHVDGDAEDGELALFGPDIGGGVAGNLERWKGQVTAADGSPLPADAAKQETFQVNGMKVSLIDVTGRYAAGMGTDKGPKDNYRMVGAIIESPSGPWYIKSAGPAATMAAQYDAIRKYINSAHSK